MWQHFQFLWYGLKSVSVKNAYCLGCVSVYQETISLIAWITLHTKHSRRLNILFHIFFTNNCFRQTRWPWVIWFPVIDWLYCRAENQLTINSQQKRTCNHSYDSLNKYFLQHGTYTASHSKLPLLITLLGTIVRRSFLKYVDPCCTLNIFVAILYFCNLAGFAIPRYCSIIIPSAQ